MASSDPVDHFVETLFGTVSQQAERLLTVNYPTLAAKVMPIVLLLSMIWVGIKVVRIHSGHDPSDVWPLARMLLTIVFVFWGLSWGAGGTAIFHSIAELRDDTLTIFMGGKSIVEYTEFAYEKFSAVANHLMAASWMNIGIVFLGLFLQFIDCALVIAVLFLKVGSDMGLAITMVLGPLFLPTLMWSNTRSYGMSWFSAMVKFALVGVLLGICVVFSFGICETFIGGATSGILITAPDAIRAKDVTACIVLEGFMLLFVAFGVRPLASALASSGAAGGGLAEMAGGFAMSQLMSRLSGGGRAGAHAGNTTTQTLNTISSAQAEQGDQLSRIERSLSAGDHGRVGGASGQPSGVGQPGGPGGIHSSSDGGGF